MELGLNGRVALVAGSSSGLGEAVARSLAAEGCNLVICARRIDNLRAVANDIESRNHVRVLPVQADLSIPEQVDGILTAAINGFSHVDILVNNAGGPPAGKFEEITEADWQKTVNSLLMSAVKLTRGVLPGMKERRWGRIINITSIAVKQPVENLMLSNSIRAAVTGFARTLSNEVAPWGITVNNVLPGYTHTQRVEYLAKRASAESGVTREEALKNWTQQIPMGRLARPSEFADMVTFIASERASYVTGTSIPVDGGWIRSLL
jgi:3-oxoacyl-[acyl-carrier protein] reductase